MALHTPLRPVRLTAFVAVLFLAVLLLGGLAACGGDDSNAASGGDGSSTTATADGGGDEAVVVAQGIAFTNDLSVEPGGAFTFDNQDATVHTLTADDGSFDSGEVPGSNQSDSMAAPDAAGSYTFHCEIHGGMTGTLTVS